MKGFLHFLRTQGIVGLAVGFVIGGAAQRFINAFSQDILNPIISKATGGLGNLASSTSQVYGMTFAWGDLVSELINLILIAFLIYFIVTRFHAAELDEKKS